jgi:pre-mRNA-processing factor SLU7
MSSSNKPLPPQDTDRNQYIPSFIAAKPFYASSLDDSDYLEHQRSHAEPKDTLDKAKWYDRGKRLPAATKYRKGACENCGSASHKTKDCLYRTRKTGAKYTGRDIQADEVVQDVSLGWDAKRDRWNGYDAREYDQVVRDYNDMESLKRAATGTPDNANGSSTPDVDDARIAEETDMGRSQPTSTRQLRLREDTAKYLVDLNLETSATYDPKTRSMGTSAPTQKANGDGVDVNAGFLPPSEAEAFSRAQKYAWETQQANTSLPAGSAKVHLEANPTEGALLLKKKQQADIDAKAARDKYLLDNYGIAPNTSTDKSQKSASKPSIISSERYVEYDSTGAVKGAPKTIARSKYPEDVLSNNHKSVWGSWWKNFTWGYACCHSTVKNSYCTGDQGREAFEEMEGMRTGMRLLEDAPQQVGVDEVAEQREEDVAKRKENGEIAEVNVKKRTMAEINSGVTEEEMEKYKRAKVAADDPMAKMLGRDDLLEAS